MGRRSVANGNASSGRGRSAAGRPMKRAVSCVEMSSDSRGVSPAPSSAKEPSKKRKQVTLTLSRDPEEEEGEAVAVKKIKTEVGAVKLTSIKKKSSLLQEQQPTARRHSIDSSYIPFTRPTSKKSRKPPTRRSVELTICLSPDVEFTFGTGRRASSGSRSRKPSSSAASISGPVESAVDVTVKTESLANAAERPLAAEPTTVERVEKKLFANLDDDFRRQNQAESIQLVIDKKTRKPSSRKERKSYPRTSHSGERRSGRRDGVINPEFNATPPTPSSSNLQNVSPYPDHRQQYIQTYEPVPGIPAPKTESSLFSWSSSSLSPIQNNDGAGFPTLVTTTAPYAGTPTRLIPPPPLPPSFQSFPSSYAADSQNVTSTADFEPTRVPVDDNRAMITTFPSISHSPSAVAPPPSLTTTPTVTSSSSSSGMISQTPADPISSLSSSYCTTPSPTATTTTPMCLSSGKVPSSNPLTPSPVSSSHDTSSLTTSPSSNESSRPVPSTPTVPRWTDPPRYEDEGNSIKFDSKAVNNNNVGDLGLSPKEITREGDGTSPTSVVDKTATSAAASEGFCPSPVSSEKDDSKSSSLELFNVRLADDVIVLKCSVCRTYTVECRSLSDVSILTKVSNHIMEHVDLMG